MTITRALRLVLLTWLTLSTGAAQISGGILSTLKIYGGVGFHQMHTADHLRTLLSDNGFASSKSTPHPIYIEEKRTYPYYGQLAKENAFIQIELELGSSFVAGAGLQSDKYGTVYGRTPNDEFATLDYRLRSKYVYGGIVRPLGRAFTFRGNAGVSLNDLTFQLDISDGLNPIELTDAPPGVILMGGIDYTLSQLASIGFIVRHNAVPSWSMPEIEWTFIGNTLSLPAHDMPTAHTDINFTMRLSIF